MNLNTAVLTDEVCVYWDLPEDADQQDRYVIMCDGDVIGETTKTHYTVGNLTPETSVTIYVQRLCGEQLKEEGCIEVTTAAVKRRIDVTKAPYNAVGDGRTMNRKALQMALDACGADEEVYFPAGVYLTGGLFVHSNTQICLEEGALLQGSEDPKDYLPKIHSRFEGVERECYQSLLTLGEVDHEGTYNCENVLIYGHGKIFGGGKALMKGTIDLEKERLKAELSALGDKMQDYEKAETIPGRARGRLIQMGNCRGVRLTGLEMGKGASWNIHMIYSDRILTDHCKIVSRDIWNGDGWDPDSSTNCTIFATEFYTGDDSVAVKSGKNPEGNVINRPTEHIRIFDCLCSFGHGLAIGSEMSGGISDVRIWDCDIEHSAYGVQIKGTPKRGAYVKDVHVSNCILPRILFVSVPYNDDGEGSKVPPVFADCSYRNIVLTSMFLQEQEDVMVPCNPIELRGFEGEDYYIDHVSFTDITIKQPVIPADGKLTEMWFDDGITSGYGAILFKRSKHIRLDRIFIE
ncbi:MAG: glycoside hydrolase family 28 protein [Lachnospiraceae bacterium]|nr:glycoside hydrolase family 28 protein [Lachnospiraceae bacterium]